MVTKEELLLELEKRPIPQELMDIKDQTLKEYNDFFGIILQRKFKMYTIFTREEMDIIQEKKTEDWLKGCTQDYGTKIFIYDYNYYYKETGKNFHAKNLLKHEIAHVYVAEIRNRGFVPRWLNEGLAYYLANQQISNKPIEEIVNCIDSHETFDVEHYGPSGKLVTVLLKKYSKEKLINLLKSSKNSNEFFSAFKNIYGFELTKKNLIENLKE
jgi:hypothetical protein